MRRVRRHGLIDIRRRRLLQGAVAGAAMGVSASPALAQQARPASQVLGAPRLALVIGNDRYREAPLRNPVNDARAIAGELEAVDFAVTLLLDATLAQMRERVAAFAQDLARAKSVGLFYFAGHGIQLSWRNYLLPVDTVVERAEQVRDRALDLGALLEGMGKAGNPANIVILDACRNNPFGADFRVEQKGLSQVDAPVGTLLAYATAPGNVAIDGEGANGLYTENLLKEMRAPDAKVEDIFKRVRLAVRRRSNGAQVPWESTSLEEDFYFQLPEELRRAAQAERERRRAAEEETLRLEEERRRRFEAELRAAQLAEEELQRRLREEREAARRAEAERHRAAAAALAERQRVEAQRRRELEAAREAKERDDAQRLRQYEEQLAAWDRLRESSDTQAIADFIYRHPSGHFTELAQLRLDQLLARQGERKVVPVKAPDNPYTKGTARTDTAFRVGDRYVYRSTDLLTGIETGRRAERVTAITEVEVIYNNGRLIRDFLGNIVLRGDGTRFAGLQQIVPEYSVGRRWITRYVVRGTSGVDTDTEIEYRVAGRERFTVGAGSFDAFRVEGDVTALSRGGWRAAQSWGQVRYWIAPETVRRLLAVENLRRRGSRIVISTREELLEFQQA